MAVDIRAINGFELAAHADWSVKTNWEPSGDPHYSQGCCFLGPPSSASNRKSTHNGVALSGFSTKHLYLRGYFQLSSLPSDGDGKIVLMQARGVGLSNPVCALGLNSLGQLELVNFTSSAADVVGTSALTLALERWYRIEVYWKFNEATQPAPNPPWESDAIMELRVDGTTWLTYGVTDYPENAGIHRKDTWQFSTFGLTVDEHTGLNYGTATDCYGFMDSLAVATGDWIGEGYVGCITPTELGTTSGWGVTTSNDELACQDHYADATGDKYTSTTALDEVTFTLPTLESLGYGAPRFVQVAILSGSVAFTGDYVLKINGTTYRNSGSIGSAVWRFSSFTQAIAPTDTIEIGIRKDNSATSRMFTRVALYFETASYTPPAIDDTVQIAYGSYAGTDADQTVTVGFEPDWILVTPVSNVQPTVWSKNASGFKMPAYQYGGTSATNSTAFARMISTGFTVRGSGVGSNASGTTYDWIAVKDRTQRVMKYGSWPAWQGAPTWDNIDVPLHGASSFTPTWVTIKGNSRTVTIGSDWMRGPGHTGDQANQWAAGLVGAYAQADAIQSLSADSFQTGSGLLATSIEFIQYWAVRDTAWGTATLWRTFTYTGDGQASQVVNLPADMASAAPRFLLVQPAAYPGATRYGYTKTPSMSAGQSKNLTSALGTVGITAWATGQFTVDDYANASGITYNVFVMTDGYDYTTADHEVTAGIVEMVLDARGAWWPIYVAPPRTWPVQCEQRYFPVEPEDRTAQVGCEQRTFHVEQNCDRTKER